jgi:DNA repair photolyase
VNAAEVLRAELHRPGWRHEVVTIGTIVDPYQPIEGR